MLWREHQHDPVDAKRQHLETGDLDGAGDDPDIGRALGDGSDDFVAEPLLQIYVDLRMGGEEGAQRFGQEFGHRVGIRHQPHLTAQAIGIFGEVAAHTVGLLQQHPGMVKRSSPDLRGVHTLPLAVQ